MAVYSRADAYRRAGDYSKALRQAQSGLSVWHSASANVWHWKFRLLTAELLLLQRDTSTASRLLQDPLPSEVPDHERLQARSVNDRGYAAYLQRKFDDALGLLERAYDLASKSSFPDLVAQICISRGYVHLAQDETGLSEDDLRASVAAAESSGDRYLLASALSNMGFLLVHLYRYDEAIQWSQRSLEISSRDGHHLVTARNLVNQGWSYYRLGDLEKALKYFGEAETSFAELGRWDDQQTALGNAGSVHYADQDYPKALMYYRQALETAEKHQLDPSKALWLNNIASTYIEMRDFRAAESYNLRALELQSRLKDPVVNILPVLNAAQIALSKSEYATAQRIYGEAVAAAPEDPDCQWETHDGLAELYSRKGEPVRAEEEYQKAVDILDTSWSALLNNQSKLTFPSRLTHFYRRYVTFLMAQHRDRDALNFVESRRARLLAEKFGTPPVGDGFQSLAKEANAVLLSYWLAPDQSYLWVTTSGGLQTFPLGPESRIRELVDHYSNTILKGGDGASFGRALYDILVAPARTLLKEGGRVVVVPDGCLHGLNFETLLAPEGHYWIQDATVEIAPSLTLLHEGHGPASRSLSILLIGDPVQTALPELPYASTEIADIAGLFGNSAVVKTGGEARPEAYRAAHPAAFEAIHFAAHAVPNRDSPLDSAVVLSQGANSAKLYAREVLEIPLSADLVTISACTSAGARTYPGEGLVGFAWAFLHAGAHNVVASLWDVSDRSTAEFMRSLYTKVHNRIEPAVALRQVKLEFLRSKDARHRPYYWAPFQVYVR